MKILVTVASRHGATGEIGDEVGKVLREAGLEADIVHPERVETLDGYDAVVVGSAIYMGRWLGPARDFVKSHADELSRLPVWLFSSGPVTAKTDDPADRAEGERLRELIGARDSRVFAGQLKKEGLGFGERTIVRMIKSPWGDYRPWPAIRSWATSIATDLAPLTEAQPA